MALSQQEPQQHQQQQNQPPSKKKTTSNKIKGWINGRSNRNKNKNTVTDTGTGSCKNSFTAALSTNTSSSTTSIIVASIQNYDDSISNNTDLENSGDLDTNETMFTMNQEEIDDKEQETMAIHTTSSSEASTNDNGDVPNDTPISKTSMKSIVMSNEKDIIQRTNYSPTIDNGNTVSKTSPTISNDTADHSIHEQKNILGTTTSTSVVVVPISLLSLQQWTIYLQNQQKILQQFQNQNQIILNSIQEHLFTITHNNINNNNKSSNNNNNNNAMATTTNTINTSQSNIESMSIPNDNNVQQQQSSTSSTNSQIDNYEYSSQGNEGHIQSKETHPINRVSLDRTTTTPDNTAELTLIRDILRKTCPQQSKINSINQSKHNDNDENIMNSVQSTQTIDPTTVNDDDEYSIHSSLQGSLYQSVASNNNNITPKKRPFEINTSSTYNNIPATKTKNETNHDTLSAKVPKQNRFNKNETNKRTPPGAGWISNQSSRSFVMQMKCNNSNSSSPLLKENSSNSALNTKTSHKNDQHSVTKNNDATTIQNPCSNQRNVGIEKRIKEEYINEGSMNNVQTDDESIFNQNDNVVQNYDINNNNNTQSLPFVYKEVVRKQAERQQLNCYDCVQCRKFYNALHRSGHDHDTDCATIFTKNNHHHSHHDHNNNNSATTKPIEFGRHRARFVPTETPTDFWELDFIDERET